MCFHRIALELGILDRERLDRALEEAHASGVAIDEQLAAEFVLSVEQLTRVRAKRREYGQTCADCGRVTYRLPGEATGDLVCEHCAAEMAPVEPKAAPADPVAKLIELAEDAATDVLKIVDRLEQDEDVQHVFHNLQ